MSIQDDSKVTTPDNMQFLDNGVRFLYINFMIYTGEILLQV